MRVAFFSLDFGFLVIAIFALLHIQEITCFPKDGCPSNNCGPAENCELPVFEGVCENRGDVCCSILKPEHRTACRHHGGECMDRCNVELMRRSNDCPANKKCCVLV